MFPGKEADRFPQVSTVLARTLQNLPGTVQACQLHNGNMPFERLAQVPRKNVHLKCVLLVVVNGFEEMEAIEILCRLRQIGICVKCLGLTSGLVDGAHGIWLMPDLTLADLENSIDLHAVKMVILARSDRGISRLETEPRLHRLLRQTLAQGGHIAGNQVSGRIFKAAGIAPGQTGKSTQDDLIHIHTPGQSFDAYTSELICCLDPSCRKQNAGKTVRKGSAEVR
jgi:hypothetical protein